jgi:hypothetical protein
MSEPSNLALVRSVIGGASGDGRQDGSTGSNGMVVGHQPPRRHLLRRTHSRGASLAAQVRVVRDAGERLLGAAPADPRAPMPRVLRTSDGSLLSAVPPAPGVPIATEIGHGRQLCCNGRADGPVARPQRVRRPMNLPGRPHPRRCCAPSRAQLRTPKTTPVLNALPPQMPCATHAGLTQTFSDVS